MTASPKSPSKSAPEPRSFLRKKLHLCLKDWLDLETDDEGAPSLSLGAFTLEDNPNLMQNFCAGIADDINLLSLKKFQRLLLSSPEKPVKPDMNDPCFNPPGIKYRSETERIIAVTYRYEQAAQDYEKRHAHYSKTFAQPRAWLSAYRANADGYLDYCKDALCGPGQNNREDDTQPDAGEIFFISRPLKISENARRRHTFLTGGTGSGKSEALKYLIRHYETKNMDAAVMVLDPHGKLAREVARFEEHTNSERLVYIDPNLSEKYHAVLNPFEVQDISVSGLETQSAQLMAAFEQILGGFTLNMESLLVPCLSVMLHRDGSDLTDFVRFMDKKQNADLVHYGADNLPFSEHRKFFETQFHSSHYDSTREALRNRFQSMMNVPTIKRFTCGASTINLPELIEQKKVIIFNLSVSSSAKAATTVIGQFITALTQGYAMRRDKDPKASKTPIHFFADECQYFVSNTTEEILGESRKYRLYLTLATQRTDQVGKKILDAILGNVGLFLVGKNKGNTVTKMSGEISVDGDDIRGLRTGSFYVGQNGKTSLLTKLPLIGAKYAMSSQDWKALLNTQVKTYYRPQAKFNERQAMGQIQRASHPKSDLSFEFPHSLAKPHNPKTK